MDGAPKSETGFKYSQVWPEWDNEMKALPMELRAGISYSQVALFTLGPGFGGFGCAETPTDKHSISTWKGTRTEPVPTSFSSRR